MYAYFEVFSVEMILMDLRKRIQKEKSLRSKVLLERAIEALEAYHKYNQDDDGFQ